MCSQLSAWVLAVVESVSSMATWVSLTVTFSGLSQASVGLVSFLSTHFLDAHLLCAPPPAPSFSVLVAVCILPWETCFSDREPTVTSLVSSKFYGGYLQECGEGLLRGAEMTAASSRLFPAWVTAPKVGNLECTAQPAGRVTGWRVSFPGDSGLSLSLVAHQLG